MEIKVEKRKTGTTAAGKKKSGAGKACIDGRKPFVQAFLLVNQNKGEIKMKETIDGKRYNTDNLEVLASRDHRTSSNNYAGDTTLCRASNGVYLLWDDSNGQDCYFGDSLTLCGNPKIALDGMRMTSEQEKRCVELGLIEIVG